MMEEIPVFAPDCSLMADLVKTYKLSEMPEKKNR